MGVGVDLFVVAQPAIKMIPIKSQTVFSMVFPFLWLLNFWKGPTTDTP